jgi:hypothetical protein
MTQNKQADKISLLKQEQEALWKGTKTTETWNLAYAKHLEIEAQLAKLTKERQNAKDTSETFTAKYAPTKALEPVFPAATAPAPPEETVQQPKGITEDARCKTAPLPDC